MLLRGVRLNPAKEARLTYIIKTVILQNWQIHNKVRRRTNLIPCRNRRPRHQKDFNMLHLRSKAFIDNRDEGMWS